MTDRYAVIGHPVAHSKSPWIHAEFARATGQDIEYRRIEAPLEGFARTVDEFRAGGGRGANVTLPFKHQAFLYCRDELSARARAARGPRPATAPGCWSSRRPSRSFSGAACARTRRR